MKGLNTSKIRRRALITATLAAAIALPSFGISPPASRAAGNTTPTATTQALVEAADGVAGDNFGAAVAIDGDLMAVGAPNADIAGVVEAGAVYLYQRDAQAPSGWTQITKLTAKSVEAYIRFGQSVALRGDVVAVGAMRENGEGVYDQGAVYIFERDQGGANAWRLAKKLSENVGDAGQFGSDVALDGDLLLVGAKGAFGLRGAAYLFDRSAGWGRIKELLDPASVIGDYFGQSVALDGDTVVVGEPRADVSGLNGNDGAAFVFQRDQGGPGTWGQVTRLVANTPEPNSQFGDAVALDGDTIVVGAWNATSGGVPSIHGGAAHVYERALGGPNAWGLVKQLATQEVAASDYYGGAVAIAGDNVWVGAHYSEAGGFTNQGVVYRYGRDLGGAGAWGQTATLLADDGSTNDRFGIDVAASGTTVAVSANGRSSAQGAVYAFSENDAPVSYTVYLPLAMEQYTLPNGILADGGVFQEPSGAIIGVVEGTLAETLPGLLVETTAPTQTLDAGAPVGNYYRLAAERIALAPVDKPFVLGLPVPSGVVTEDLAVAVLLPPGSVLDADKDEPQWVASMGHYDADDNLFVVTLSTLTPAGFTVVLVSDPVYEPIPTTTFAAARGVELPPSFYVTCALDTMSTCTEANKKWVSEGLVADYADLVTTLHFMPPDLNDRWGEFLSRQRAKLGYSSAYIGIEIAELCEEGGDFDGVTKVLRICLPAAPGEIELQDLRHEFFHAIQHAYPNLALDWYDPTAEWLIEGTATAAGISSDPMKRRLTEPRRSITLTLTEATLLDPHQTQDFWVYTGLRGGQSVAYLRPIFAAGGTPQKIYSALVLDDAYWRWVKNQAFEKTERTIDHEVDADDDFAYPECALEPSLVDLTLSISYPTQSDITGTLKPLQSAVVGIVFEQAAPFVTVSAEAGFQDANLRYKVYDEEGVDGCAGLPDRERTLRILAADAPTVRFVVLSNVSASESLGFEVTVVGG